MDLHAEDASVIFDSSEELMRRIEEFKLHPVHKNLKNQEVVRMTKTKLASQSILEKAGVRVQNEDKKSFFFRCLVGDCYARQTLIRITKSSTSNATEHIRQVHEAISAKTIATRKKIDQISKLLDTSEPSFVKDPQRWFACNITAWHCEQPSLAFQAMQSERWKVIAAKLPCGPNGMAPINIRKHLIEHYVTVKSTITTAFAIGKSQFSIPFLAIQIDLVTAKSSSMKFIGIRASMNCSGAL